ncbi:MAG: alginate lyase family protein [Armatimonadetes bacterium]|nr:alginate lyase family protein [Candidatus Hippobium faecium]
MRNIDRFEPPLSEKLLSENDFFSLCPFDGGGHFVTRDILGTEKDEEIALLLLREGLPSEFGALEKPDFHKCDKWSLIEKSSWINRLYFIVPIAKHARLKNDPSAAQTVINILLGFYENDMRPATKADTYIYEKQVSDSRKDYNAGCLKTDIINYQWYDFQPASRIIHILYSMYFLKDFGFREEIWQNLDELVYRHGENIDWSDDIYNLAPGNHQALRGLALLMAGDYFGKKDWLEKGLCICSYHILNDFLPDGMILDISPSYHFFECWIMRDALKLAERNGLKFSQETEDRLEKAFLLCEAFCDPTGHSPVVSDGYSLDMKVFLSSLPKFETKKKNFVHLDKSGIDIYKKNKDYLLFDCSPLVAPQSHFHGGKQAFCLYYEGMPFVCDSGCCNYDYREFEEYYKQPFAHSSMLVNGKGDSTLQGKYLWVNSPVCKLKDWQDGIAESSLISDSPLWKDTVWNRKIKVSDKKTEIWDTVKSAEEKEYVFIFNLHSDVLIEKKDDYIYMLKNGNVLVKAQFSCSVTTEKGMICSDCRNTPTNRLICRIKAKDCKFTTIFEKMAE